MLLVVTGTSGAGKGAIVTRLLERYPDLWYSVSTTTRPRRPGEEDGREYFFVERTEFERLRAAGEFLESFEVYGHLYGTPVTPVEEHLAAGRDVVLELDVQGALAVKDRLPGSVLVFVRAPSKQEQRRRLDNRGESGETIERRMTIDEAYEAQAHRFDHVVVNDDLDEAEASVAAILENSRSGP